MPDSFEIAPPPDSALPGMLTRMGKDLGLPREITWGEFFKWRSGAAHRSHADLKRIRRDFGAHLQRFAVAISITSKPLSPLQKLEDVVKQVSKLLMESAVTSDTAWTNASGDTETSQQALERKQLVLDSRKLQCENVAKRLEGFGIDSSLL